jgi:hypothetical protein
MRRMHDPKFEKEVQQKLEELSFSPSDAVWDRVEQAVNSEKRRRAPVLWFWLLPAIVLTGAGLVYFSESRKAAADHRMVVKAAGATDKEAVTPAREGNNEHNEMKDGDKAGENKEGAAAVSDAMEKAKVSMGVAGNRIGHGKEKTIAKNEVIAATALRNNDKKGKRNTDRAAEGLTGKEEMAGNEPTIDGIDMAAAGKEHLTRGAYQQLLPGLHTFDHHFSAPAPTRLKARSQSAVAARSTIQLEPKHTWQMGFAGGIGASSINSTLFQQQPVVSTDLGQYAAPVSGRPKTYTSQVKLDLSYWAGIVAQRPLNKNLTLSLGLDLHYYSARVQVGEKVYNNAANSVASSLIMPAAPPATLAAAYPAYSVGNNDVFVNRYYFLELPASILWQVSHSRNLPLFWESGIALSYLVSSNAVYYNAKSSVFYKDGSMTNKTQFNLATALLVGLPIRGIRIQAGPQIQYGLTSLQNQGSGGQHLFYGGLRVIVLPGKVRK